MRYLKKNMLYFAGFLLFSGALFLNMGILTHAAGSKTIKAGEQLTLRAGSSSSSYRWQVSDTSVLSPGENGKQFCKISGLRAGTLEDSSLNRRTDWNNQGLLAVKRNGLWGYADRNLNLVIPFQFTDAQDFEGSHFGKVKAGGQFYYINEKGEYIIRLTPGVFYNTLPEAGWWAGKRDRQNSLW